MNDRSNRPDAESLQADGLTLPGYGRDLEVRPYPLTVRGHAALHVLAAEGVSSFLGRMMALTDSGPRLH